MLRRSGHPAGHRGCLSGNLQAEEANYLLFGMWTNAALKKDYGLEEGVDYSIFQFPALGMGFDDTSSVDTKELVVTSNGNNPAAADAFLDFIIGPDAANIMGKYGYASPSTAFDTSLLGPVQQTAVAAVAGAKVQFVLGDLLPGDWSMNTASSCSASCRIRARK